MKNLTKEELISLILSNPNIIKLDYEDVFKIATIVIAAWIIMELVIRSSHY